MNQPLVPGGVGILPARRDDLRAIMHLERAGFPADEQWSERSWQGELLGEGQTVLVARAQHPIGVVTFKTIGELADLHRLVVDPQWRGQGVGAALVRAGLRIVRHHGAKAVMLEVAYTNEPAIALYQRIGFEQLSARQNYYGPGQHALILKLYDLHSWPDQHRPADQPVESQPAETQPAETQPAETRRAETRPAETQP
jgi:ribosomal-protein-alanine N-acetyltransferase